MAFFYKGLDQNWWDSLCFLYLLLREFHRRTYLRNASFGFPYNFYMFQFIFYRNKILGVLENISKIVGSNHRHFHDLFVKLRLCHTVNGIQTVQKKSEDVSVAEDNSSLFLFFQFFFVNVNFQFF